MTHGRPITVLEFNGPRFEDHGLDVDVLPEIVAFKRLLQETAKELWRRKNPDRQRLPRHFNDEISLKFFTIEAGSTGVPLVRATAGQRAPRLPFENELDEAALLLQSSIRSAGKSEMPPSTLPRSVIPLFQDFGRALRADEFIVVTGASSHSGARYDNHVKARILSWVSGTYTDPVDLTGEVRGTDLDGLKFTLRLPDGRKIPGRFEPDQELVVLEALNEHTKRQLRVIGQGEFSPDDGSLIQIVSVDLVELYEPTVRTPPERPIWERLSAIGAAIPAEAWKDVPTDLATNADHYLYGTKKGSH
jgi:hypothetical protein